MQEENVLNQCAFQIYASLFHTVGISFDSDFAALFANVEEEANDNNEKFLRKVLAVVKQQAGSKSVLSFVSCFLKLFLLY